MTIGAALADASRLRHRLPETRFAVAYGSHARGTDTSSDLDLLFAGDSALSDEQVAWLTAEVRFLHHRHGLRLDQEVAYEAKLYATRDEISDAMNFGGYNVDAAGGLIVPPVLIDPAYLNSAGFKSRLLLNALTSPHVFLGGDVGRYRKYQARAACTVALVALSPRRPGHARRAGRCHQNDRRYERSDRGGLPRVYRDGSAAPVRATPSRVRPLEQSSRFAAPRRRQLPAQPGGTAHARHSHGIPVPALAGNGRASQAGRPVGCQCLAGDRPTMMLRREDVRVTDAVAAKNLVDAAVSAAMARVLPAELAGSDPLVRRSEHADFQSNIALAVAKQAGRPPRDIATDLAAAIDVGIVSANVSGPGFLNLQLRDSAIWQSTAGRLSDTRLGIGTPLVDERVVIDYSAPNIAKEMHVGHLRTTIIGDALARVLGFLGAQVIRQNHLGDWGTQFGMLIQYLDEHPELPWRQQDTHVDTASAVSALDALYRAARQQFDADPEFADRARSRVVALQAGDADTLAVWRELVAESEHAFQAIYDRLGVLLTPADSAGESTYNPYLTEVVDELVAAGIAVESNGALCVFFDDITGPDGDPVPLIVRKNDGGFGYAATDLATIRYRIRDLKATRILYVVDARQALHFRMIFTTARRAGWLTDDVHAVHVPFGTVLGPDGRPFKTRSGGTVRLTELLDAAVDQARAVVAEKTHGLDPEQLEHVVQAAGIGAVKYADLSTSRTKDYAFDVDRMVSLNGNTGVYLQYAHARIQSILRKLPAGEGDTPVDISLLLAPAERALALCLEEFAEVLSDVAETLEPHRLCNYLFTVAKTYTSFYENCPVLKAETAALRSNRIALCRLTARTLTTGLGLLGIEAPERM